MNKLALYWGGVTIILPLYLKWQQVGMFRLSRSFLLCAFTFLSIIIFGIKRDVLEKYRFIILGFAYFSAVSFLIQYKVDSRAVAVQWLCLNAGMLLAMQLISQLKKEDFKIFFTCIGVSCLIQSAWLFIHYLGIDPVLAYHKYINGVDLIRWDWAKKEYYYGGISIDGPRGGMGNPTISGAFLGVTVPALFENKYLKWFVPFVLFCIYVTSSSMSILCTIGGILAYLFYKLKSINFKTRLIGLATFPSVGLVLYLINPHHPFFNLNMREKIWPLMLKWNSGFEILFGKGLGYLHDKFTPTFKIYPWFKSAHSEIVDFYVAFGIVGLTIMGYILYKAIRLNKEPVVAGMFFAVLTNALANFPMHIAPIAVIGIISFSMMFTRSESYGLQSI